LPSGASPRGLPHAPQNDCGVHTISIVRSIVQFARCFVSGCVERPSRSNRQWPAWQPESDRRQAVAGQRSPHPTSHEPSRLSGSAPNSPPVFYLPRRDWARPGMPEQLWDQTGPLTQMTVSLADGQCLRAPWPKRSCPRVSCANVAGNKCEQSIAYLSIAGPSVYCGDRLDSDPVPKSEAEALLRRRGDWA